MKTARLYLLLALLLMVFGGEAFGQENYLWPVKGKKAGEDILYKPQSYIGNELNANDLIIATPLNTNILAPVDGTITWFNYSFQTAMNYSTSYHRTPTDYRQDSLYFAEAGESDVQFINLSVGIQTADGTMIYISGLRPTTLFMTGQKVQRGEVIGTTGYYYKKIKEPCICIGISKNKIPADPMSPFGLKTTFQEPDTERKTTFTKEEATEDYNIFIDALKEGFPGLYDYVSEAEFEQFTSSKREGFGEMVSTSELETALNTTISLIRDSHTALLNPVLNDNPRFSTIDFGIQGDSMLVVRTSLADKAYYGKRILTVNGISCDSMKALIQPYHHLFDGFVESYAEFDDLCQLGLWYCYYIQPEPKYDLLIEFADGETKLFKGGSYKTQKCFPRKPSWQNWYLTNLLEPINFRMISDTTAYLGIRDFELNQVEVEQIKEHVAQMANDSITNLIIDLRNNGGGNVEVMAEIYSFIAQKPFRQEIYRKVNKRGDFDFFRYSSNHAEGQEMFPKYEPTSDGDGFILDLSDEWLQPDSVVNYKGKVYLFANERSFSAAATFTGWVKSQNRGVIVGRETGSTYHQMKAIKFEDLMLPNSKYIIHFPLIQTVMDTIMNERFPYGRGVLPDYEVKLKIDELSSPNDTILDYTLQLIREGKYIYYVEPEPETWAVEEEKPSNWWIWVLVGVAALAVIAVVVKFTANPSRRT